MTSGDVMKLMDLLGRPRLGPCAFCGYPDARHRVADEVVDRTKAGDPLDMVLAEFGLDGPLQGGGTAREFFDKCETERAGRRRR